MLSPSLDNCHYLSLSLSLCSCCLVVAVISPKLTCVEAIAFEYIAAMQHAIVVDENDVALLHRNAHYALLARLLYGVCLLRLQLAQIFNR